MLLGMTAQLSRCDVYRARLPIRSFEHAAARRDTAEAVLVRVTLTDGAVGWGETHPRSYVTGESVRSVANDIRETLWPALTEAWPARPDAERISAGVAQWDVEGRCTNAAACALELAALDAARAFPGVGRSIHARVSGVLGSEVPDRTEWRLRLMWAYGLRDFKLKLALGGEVDAENLRRVQRRLGGPLRYGTCTLRADVNGGWKADETPERTESLRARGFCAVEQPVFAPAGELGELAARCCLPLVADESLVTSADADELSAAGAKVWWNIRLSKNGGLVPSLALARRAAERGIPFVVGSMVGESGILSLWQRRLLQAAPVPRFVEGNYGRFLLKADLLRRSPRFGYGGRLRPPPAHPPHISRRRLARHATHVATLRA
ncbi:MAG: enolase C-terminal domain-like protein [Planctomycetota bacterium]